MELTNELPGGKWIVILSKIPDGDKVDETYKHTGIPDRRNWVHYRLYKKQVNARKAFHKKREKYWKDFIVTNNLLPSN